MSSRIKWSQRYAPLSRLELVELGLGTVQFGLAYGVAGRSEPVPEAEVREILALAYAGGIRMLDTAAAYGDIERRLVPLCGERPFKIVTKVPSIPAGMSARKAADFAASSARQSHALLGNALSAMLFHNSNDLLNHPAGMLWDAVRDALSGSSARLGVSCYHPDELRAVRSHYPVQVTQLPCNALDQSLRRAADATEAIEVHVRSVFLQGLLLMPRDEAAARVPAAAGAMERWHDWCQRRGFEPLRAALAAVKDMPNVRYVIVGVDRPAQLEHILEAWHSTGAVDASELACELMDVIDPRRWPR